MAYIVASASEISDVASASYVSSFGDLSYVTNDLIIQCVTQDGGATAIATATSGWNAIGTQAASGGSRQGWFYKLAASSSETAPTYTGSNDDWIVQTIIIRDVDTTTPIHDNARADWNAVETVNSPALTTTNNDCLLLYSWCADSTGAMVFDTSQLINIDKTAGLGQISIVGYHQQFTAGSAPTVEAIHQTTAEGGNAWVIAINNKSGGGRDLKVSGGKDVLNYMGSLLSTTAAVAGAANSVTGLTTIDGVTLSSTLPTISDNVTNAAVPWGLMTQLNCTVTLTNTWQGVILTLPAAADMLNNILSLFLTSPIKALTRVGPRGVAMVLVDSLDNWAAYTLKPYSQLATNGFYSIVMQPAAETALDESATPIDLTNVNRVGFLMERTTTTSTSNVFNIANITLLDTCTIVGGSATRPIVSSDFEEIFNEQRFYRIAQTQGSGQAVIKQPLQLGNGTDATYVTFTANSIEVANPLNDYTVEDNFSNITLYGSASDVFDLSSCILATTQENTFTIHASSSASATYNFSGATLKGFNIVNSVSGISINSATIITAPSITLNGGTLSACTLDSCAPVTTNNPANITNCEFTSAGTGHAITITATGTFDFDDNTFTGYGADGTTDAAIYNNSGGAVTLNIPLGGQVPTIRNGAGASTTINTPSPGYTLELPNIIDGSRYQIYNVTADVELDNAVVSGGSGISHLYTEGVDFTAGDIGRYRVAYQSGTTAKQTLEGTFTFPSGTTTNSLPVSQTDQAEYIAYGVDGSTITEFTWDSGNVQVDINDTDNATQVQRVAAWYYYFITTATGIDEAFNAITWLALNQIRINTSVVDMRLDNTKATPLYLTGGRLFRDNNTTIIASTSNSIQLDYEPVYTVETGTSGLTPTEAATLAVLDNFSFTSGNVNANIEAVNAVALQGAGVEGDEWRPA